MVNRYLFRVGLLHLLMQRRCPKEVSTSLLSLVLQCRQLFDAMQVETGDVQAVMDGEIDQFIKAYLMEYA